MRRQIDIYLRDAERAWEKWREQNPDADARSADACIREYLRDVSKLKVDHIKAIAAQRKDGQQTTPADQGTLSVQPDIDKLKDCLGKFR